MIRVLVAFLLAVGLSSPAMAVTDPAEVLDDPVLEERARALSSEIRCLVCQNESIDESNAELAQDLRALVRERLVAGDTDREVLDFLVARYGDFVLLRPPVDQRTYLLWYGPLVILVLAAGGIMVRTLRKKPTPVSAAPVALSDDERKRIDALLRPDDR